MNGDEVDERIRLRPHHLLCTLCYRGKGYSAEFERSYWSLAGRLRHPERGEKALIEVAEGPDDICGFCPKLSGSLCETQEKVERLDAAHSSVLGLRPGDRLTWGEVKRRLAERMSIEAFHEACACCGWRPLGICETVLEELIATTGDECRHSSCH